MTNKRASFGLSFLSAGVSSPSSPTGGRVRRGKHRGISSEPPRPRERYIAVKLGTLALMRPDKVSRPPFWGRTRPVTVDSGKKD